MTSPSDVFASAAAWSKVSEQPPGSNNVPGITDWYGMRGPWCAMWVSRVFYDAGLPLPAQTAKGFAWCTAGANWFAEAGRLVGNSREALPGDVVFFEWDNVGALDHVGIVLQNNGDSLTTIEGNINDRVGIFRRYYPEAVSLGRPAYTTPTPTPPEDEMKSLVLIDHRYSPPRGYHAFGNSKVALTDWAQVEALKFLGVAVIDPAPATWLDALAVLPRNEGKI